MFMLFRHGKRWSYQPKTITYNRDYFGFASKLKSPQFFDDNEEPQIQELDLTQDVDRFMRQLGVRSGNAIDLLKGQGYKTVNALKEQVPTVEELRGLGFTLFEAKTLYSELSNWQVQLPAFDFRIDENDFAYQSYLYNALAILQDPSADAMVQTLLIDAMQIQSAESRPLVFLISSAGTGKTQMAFNAAQYVRAHELPVQVHYLPSDDASSEAPITHLFARNARLFFHCCKADMRRLKSISRDVLEKETLETFGFLSALLSQGADGKPRAVSPCSCADLHRLIALLDKQPIFFLDDWAHKDLDNIALQFVCNVFRALELPAIVMGSDFSVVEPAATSPRQDFTRLSGDVWCRVYHTLPKFAPVEPEMRELPNWFQQLLKQSRPQFAQYALEFLHETDQAAPVDPDGGFMNTLVDYVGLKIYSERNLLELNTNRSVRLFDTHRALLHQLCLFMHAPFYPGDPTGYLLRGQSASLLRQHFGTAALIYPFPITLTTDEGALFLNDNELWYPTAGFPAFRNDVLLYLSVMGTNSLSPFYCRRIATHRLTLLQSLAFVGEHFYSELGYETEREFLRHFALHDLLSAGLTIASHHDMRGNAIYAFIERLVAEVLSIRAWMSYNTIGSNLNAFLTKTTIPYMSLNRPFPESIMRWKSPTLLLGNLKRPRLTSDGSELVCYSDLAGDSIALSCETGDYSLRPDGFSLRIPAESNLHFVLSLTADGTDASSESLFASKLNQSQKTNERLTFAKVVVEGDSIRLGSIADLPFADPGENAVSRLVLYLETSYPTGDLKIERPWLPVGE